MVKITFSNLYSAVRQNIYTILNEHLPDPANSTSSKRKWLYSRMPDVKSKDFGGFPFVVIPNPTVSLSDHRTGQGSMDMTKRYVEWESEITVVASDRGWGNNNGKGLQYTESICDNLLRLFLNIDIRRELQDLGMYFSIPQVSSVDTTEMNNTLVYEVSLFLNFATRLRVSDNSQIEIPCIKVLTEGGIPVLTEGGLFICIEGRESLVPPIEEPIIPPIDGECTKVATEEEVPVLTEGDSFICLGTGGDTTTPIIPVGAIAFTTEEDEYLMTEDGEYLLLEETL
jgi:hypothetical protein